MIIIVDLDSTLLNDKGQLTDKTIQVLNRCKLQGHKIVINSARSYVRCLDIATKINADYINCFYGNLVVNAKGQIIYSRRLIKKNIKNLVKDIHNIYNDVWSLDTFDGGYTTDQEMVTRFDCHMITVKEMLQKKPYRIVFKVTKKYVDKILTITQHYNLDAKMAREGDFCSIIPPQSDKANGIKYILQIKENKDEKTIAFGDEIADLKTLELVNIPVAMANSTQAIKGKIKEKTLSNNQDGVAKYLEKMLQKKIV